MSERYATRKVFKAVVQSTTNKSETEGSKPSFHWEVQETSTGATAAGPFANQAEAEDACLKLNSLRT